MSYYDNTHKSGYGHNSHIYKVETYVEEIRKPRVVEYRYPSYPTKMDPTYTYNHDRPPEVNDLITKILTEVNGPPAITTISDSGTYRGQHIPVRVESKKYYTEDPWYGSYPSNPDYGSQYNDPSSIDHGVPKQDLDYPSNQLNRYPHPEYTQSPKNESYGRQPPKWEPYGSDNQRKPETIKTFGVPRTYWGSSYQSDSPKYGGLQNQWGDAPTNPSNFRPEVARDERDPNKRWGDSPTKSQTIGENGGPKGYRVPLYEYDDSPTKLHNGYEIPNNPPYTQWGGSPVKAQTRQDYGVPSKPQSPKDHRGPHTQWGGSPVKSQTQQDYGVPSKPQSPQDHRGPYTQWGGSPVKSQTQQDYGVSSKPQSPKDHRGPYTQWGSSPVKSQTRVEDYGVPSKPQSPKDHRGPYTQWGGSPVKSQTRVQDYGDPSKPQSPRDHRGPYAEWGGSPKDSHDPVNYGIPNNQQNSSSGPNVYQHPPEKFDALKDYEAPENKLRNSPVNSPTLRGYGDPNDHLWDSSSNQVYSQPPNTQFPSEPRTYNEQGHSPMKKQTHPNYKTLSNPWDESTNHSYEPQSQPPPMTCKDGVCTLNDKPKITHNTTSDHVQNDGRSNPYTHENQPKKGQQNTSTNGTNNNTRASTPLGRATNNNMEESLGQLSITDQGYSPNVAASLTSPGAGLSALSHSRPETENPKESTRTSIDSREAAKRYGGLGVPLRPYSSEEDQSRVISSTEALQKYNGSIVPK